MSKALEDMRNEAEYNSSVEIAMRMIARGKATLEEIAEDTGLALSKVQELSVNNFVSCGRLRGFSAASESMKGV